VKQLSKPLLLLAIAAALSSPAAAKQTRNTNQSVAVAPQYDTTHVYVAPEDVDKFVASFLATFGARAPSRWSQP
jgi:hypothetical protein